MRDGTTTITLAELQTLIAETEAEWAKMDAEFAASYQKHLAFRNEIRKQFEALAFELAGIESGSSNPKR